MKFVLNVLWGCVRAILTLVIGSLAISGLVSGFGVHKRYPLNWEHEWYNLLMDGWDYIIS